MAIVSGMPMRMRALLMAALLLAGAAGGAVEALPPTVLFLIGEPEYQTAATLPAFAASELAPHGLRCVVAGEDPADRDDFTGLDALPGADLLVVSVRRHAPTREHLALVRAHLAAGKPLIGIRTASHAFAAEPKDARHEGWPGFDAEVLGGSYHGHYGDVPAVLALAPGAGAQAILAGVDPAAFAATRLYRNPTLAPGAVPLLLGSAQGATERQHVAWTNQAGRSRVFYTSLGTPGDFATPAFRRLLRNAVFWALDRAPPTDPPSP